MKIKDQLKVLNATAKAVTDSFWDLYEPAIYIDKKATGWEAEVYVFDKFGTPGKNNHLLGTIQAPKRSAVIREALGAFKAGGVWYPGNQVIDMTQE